MRISDWSSDVCSSDLSRDQKALSRSTANASVRSSGVNMHQRLWNSCAKPASGPLFSVPATGCPGTIATPGGSTARRSSRMLPFTDPTSETTTRSEEHTSELQSLMRISYAVFCLKKKKKKIKHERIYNNMKDQNRHQLQYKNHSKTTQCNRTINNKTMSATQRRHTQSIYITRNTTDTQHNRYNVIIDTSDS